MDTFNAFLRLGLFATCALAIAGIVYVYRYRRPDRSWRQLFAAGPMLYLRPAEYVRPGYARIPRTLFLLSLLLFITVWVASWVHDNV